MVPYYNIKIFIRNKDMLMIANILDSFFTRNQFSIGQSNYLDMVASVFFSFSLRHKLLCFADSSMEALPAQFIV
jgi:hypothetical protein